jgi:maltose-binding protein MalE
MGAVLSYHEGTFFLIYTDVKSQKRPCYNTHNYLVWTGDIAGEWSEPVYLNSTGFDPSLFHDGDKKYLVNMRNGFNGILLQEYDHKKRALVGEVRTIYKGTELGFTEGPHLYRRGGYYYLVTAEGGTGYGHAVTVARAESIAGPYETDPQNPMLTSRDDPSLRLQKAGHASLVEMRNGEWLMVLNLIWSNQVASYQGAMTDKVAICPLPNGEHNALAIQVSQYLAINSTSENKEAAALFINFFVTQPSAGEHLGTNRGIPSSPVVRAAIAGSATEIDAMLYNYLNLVADRTVPQGPNLPNDQEFIDTLKQIGQSVAFGQESREDGAQEIYDTIHRLMVKE